MNQSSVSSASKRTGGNSPPRDSNELYFARRQTRTFAWRRAPIPSFATKVRANYNKRGHNHRTMTTPFLSREQSRTVDRRAIDEYHMSGLVLMENAGRGVAEALLQLDPNILTPLTSQPNVEILCGKGNNAGDGFVIARHLDIRGVRCRTILLHDPQGLTGDAQTNYEILKRSDVPIIRWPEVAAKWKDDQSGTTGEPIQHGLWIVDALLGTGSSGDPRPPLDDAIRAMNQQPARRLAVDVPSGLDCDTGQPGSPTVRANHTCTFVAYKQGFKTSTAQTYTGLIEVIDIGTPPRLLHEFSE